MAAHGPRSRHGGTAPATPTRGVLRRRATLVVSIALTGAGLVAVGMVDDEPGAAPGMRAEWCADATCVTLAYAEKTFRYPADVRAEAFPAPGAPPRIENAQEWPVSRVRARWSMSGTGWPEAFRSQALDVILLWVCDAERYAETYPEVILASSLTTQPVTLDSGPQPAAGYAERLRDHRIGYRVKADAGLGAADYTIDTVMRVGLSDDGKTAFYHDQPRSISAHLLARDFAFVVHDAGDRLLFEVHAVTVSAPRKLFRGEALRRVAASAEYLIQTMYGHLSKPPRSGELQAYITQVQERWKPAASVEPGRRGDVSARDP